MRRFQLIACLLLSAASPVLAQRIEDARVAADRPSAENAPRPEEAVTFPSASRTSASTRSMVVGGIIGGVLGAFGGAAVGVSIENCDGDNCGLAGAVIGGIVGEAIGVPIGVNYAANGTGTLRRTIPVSLAMTAVCTVMAYMTAGTSILMIPPMQIYTSIRAERTGSSGFLGM
jgi:hypothetical protein